MWKIKDVKERGKICYRKNSWRAILVALVIVMIGGMSGSNGLKGIVGFTTNIASAVMNNSVADSWEDYSYNDSDGDGVYDEDDLGDIDNDIVRGFEDGFAENGGDQFNADPDDVFAAVAIILLVFLFVILIIALVAMVIGLLIRFFLFNPLFIGTQRFFVHNLSGMGQVGDLGFGFDRQYKNQVNVMFFRDLFTFAWSLLFFFPGLYKSYEYRMIPYLMAEYPDMSKEQAFFTSKYLMNGNKWRAFLFDLSFIGWWILNVFTLGLLGLFYVNPYYASSCAALYEVIKSLKGIPEYRDPRQMYDPVTGNPIGGNPPMPTPVYRPSTPVYPAPGAANDIPHPVDDPAPQPMQKEPLHIDPVVEPAANPVTEPAADVTAKVNTESPVVNTESPVVNTEPPVVNAEPVAEQTYNATETTETTQTPETADTTNFANTNEE